MKSAAFAFALATVCFTTTAAFAATTDDVKWINQCVTDNKGGAAHEVVLKYCTCMNNKMSDNETQSITAVGKDATSPNARPATRKPAGDNAARRPMRPSRAPGEGQRTRSPARRTAP